MDKSKKNRRKKRQNKIHLVFDEKKRTEFLTGFHKRKVQRKKKYEEKLKEDLKKERKRLKQEAKESYKKLVVSHRGIPELNDLFTKEYEDDDVTVKIEELSTDAIAKQYNWIGSNQASYETNKDNDNEDEESEEENKNEEIIGMELKRRKKPTEKVEKQQFNTKKELKKALKKEATKKLKKSKIFQRKNQMEQRRQRKKSLMKKKLDEKTKKKKR